MTHIQKTFYDRPAQVLVNDEGWEGKWKECMAIAYKDFVIFADNGDVCPLSDVIVLKDYSKNWVSFDEFIGEETEWED